MLATSEICQHNYEKFISQLTRLVIFCTIDEMSDTAQTISDRIQNKLEELTRAERQLALSILENYPASGLGPLSALAKDAEVSVPTGV